MKRIVLVCFLLATSILNAQSCWWLKGADGGATNSDYAYGIATDLNGNVYVTGLTTSSTIQFGSTTLSGSGMFLVKYDPAGNVLWAKNPTSGNGQGTSVATDSKGNAYVTGVFGTMVYGTTTLTTAGSTDVFLVKYDSLGNVLWAINAGGGSNQDYSYNVSVDKSDNPIITGESYSPSMTIGTYSVNFPYYTTGGGNTDYFVAKYDASGNFIWAHATGGNRYDGGYSITTDQANNIYVAGMFMSDTLTFGIDTLLVNPSSGKIFVTKYDSTGGVIWAKSISNGFSSMSGGNCQIKCDALNNLYLSGEFSGNPLIIGNDTLFNVSGGNANFFLAKFDTSLTLQWMNGSGSNNYECINKGLAVNASGESFISGYFKGQKLPIGNDTLINPYNTYPCLYIAKFDANGNILWGRGSSGNGTSTVISEGMTCGIGENVYIAGHYVPNSLTFGNSTITNLGSDDAFIVDVFSFSSGVALTTSVSCNGGSDAIAVAGASGGNLPYSYSWNTIPVQTNDTAFNIPAGTYTLAVTEGYGCTQYSTVTITEPAPDSLHLCMVTVDSASQYNILSWDKTSLTDIDSFIVYREISTNNYQPIAAIPYDSLSMFVDTVRTLYFPNTGDPNAGTYRYKLRGHLVCGGYTGLSPFHNTIYFLNNNGTFYWVQPYTIQGSPNPVSSYVLLRDNNSNGNWQAVSSVAGTQQLVSDPLYSIYQNTATWRVQTQWNISCTPTAKQNGINSAFSSSYSNTYTNIGIGIKNNELSGKISLYPSPNSGSFTVECPYKNPQLELYNMMGQLVYKTSLNKNATKVETQGLSKGTYFAHITCTEGKSVKKVVIE